MTESELLGKWTLRLGALICGLAVVLGAFGAHALETRLPDWYEGERAMEKLESWKTGIQYQMLHGLVLLFLGGLAWGAVICLPRLAVGCFLFGILVFSGGLYLWVLTDWKPFVLMVPVGGVCFVLGWVAISLNSLPRPSATLPAERSAG